MPTPLNRSPTPLPPEPSTQHYPPARGARLWLPPGPDAGSRFDIRDPCMWTLLAAVFACLLIAAVRTDVRYARSAQWYWMAKHMWGPTCEAVVIGDSRVYRGVDPRPLEQALSGTVCNFGFSSAKLTPKYLAHAQQTLAPSGEKLIIVGISSYCLSGMPAGGDDFIQSLAWKAASRLPLAVERLRESWEEQFTPFDLELLFPTSEKPLRALDSDYSQRFHNSGWVESDRVVDDPVALGLKNSAAAYAVGHRPTAESVAAAVDALAGAVDAGFRVVAVSMPVPTAVRDAEWALESIDLAALRRQLTARGIEWIEIPCDDLSTYDGSHLNAVSARLFSQRLAEAIPTRKH